MSDEVKAEAGGVESLMAIMSRVKFAPPRDLTPEELAAHEAKEQARAERERARAVEAAEAGWLRLVGKRYAWARPTAPELATRCWPQRTAGGAASAQEAIDAIVRHEGNVVLRGLPGTGKTSLLCAALRVLYDRHDWRQRLVMADAYELGSARIQHPAGQGEAPPVEAAMGATLLLLDDLGNERQTQNNAVPDVVMARHHADVPTWFSTGETREQIAAKYGGGVMRRIFDGALVIEMRKGER